jgi:hypothetical protein
MMRAAWPAALILSVAVLGCEKDPAGAASPGPTVIVGEPGAEQPGDTGSPTDGPSPEPTQPATDEFGSLEIVVTEVPCQSDADCVKDSCCHATSCVALADAPSCADTMCTMDCRAGTTDCYGGCMCQDGRCAAQLWTPPGDDPPQAD